MEDIRPLTAPSDDENRHLLCQMAIEIPLQDLIESAVNAGWDETEVLTAIIDVADNLVLAHGSNAKRAAEGTEAEPGVTAPKREPQRTSVKC
ncbi:Hypothetical protein NGAL_HAMBI2605_38360 [Neorhizobium galegae bv. orientalis]|nr:Hypothetical protein NGAL_HAMBI2605_38360 [Neorhizobium galegae bv. orientalis]